MRWIVAILVVCVLAAPAAAGPPSERAARHAAAAWFRGAVRGAGSLMAAVSARPVKISIDKWTGCPVHATARSRRQFARVARRLKGCELPGRPATWKVEGGRVTATVFDSVFTHVFVVTVNGAGKVASVWQFTMITETHP